MYVSIPNGHPLPFRPEQTCNHDSSGTGFNPERASPPFRLIVCMSSERMLSAFQSRTGIPYHLDLDVACDADMPELHVSIPNGHPHHLDLINTSSRLRI